MLTPAQQEMLITRYPRGPRAQTRFLLDHYEIRPDVLASLLGMRRWTVRRLAGRSRSATPGASRCARVSCA
ncbi:hypothetical protein ACFQ2K_04120 [Streptomyces sanglieri]|uniref:Transposase n=1 Tax=Streptomyces sanglieri TaxID=193460 RepID=A0ABW2WQK8_9ACTN